MCYLIAFICSRQRSINSNLESADWQTAENSGFTLPTFFQLSSDCLFFWVIRADCIAWTDFGNKRRASLLLIVMHFQFSLINSVYISYVQYRLPREFCYHDLFRQLNVVKHQSNKQRIQWTYSY